VWSWAEAVENSTQLLAIETIETPGEEEDK
jgi:hypothetical protein